MGDAVNQSVQHGGNVHQVAKALGRPVSSFVDFSASINPLGPPASVLRAMRQALAGCVNYPDPQSEILRERLASEHGISQESILLGNGSAELIRVLPKALGLHHGYVVGPTFMEFEYSLKVAGAGCTYVHAESTRRYTPPLERLSQTLAENGLASRMMGRKNVASDLAVFFCHPNSPTGRVVPVQHLRQMMRHVDQAGCWMIVDEAFIEFSSSPSLIKDVTKHQRLLVLRSFTKILCDPRNSSWLYDWPTGCDWYYPSSSSTLVCESCGSGGRCGRTCRQIFSRTESQVYPTGTEAIYVTTASCPRLTRDSFTSQFCDGGIAGGMCDRKSRDQAGRSGDFSSKLPDFFGGLSIGPPTGHSPPTGQ